MDLKVGGRLSKRWRASAAFTGSYYSNTKGNSIAIFGFRDGGYQREREYGVMIAWDDLASIAELLADSGDKRALLIREFLYEPDKLNQMEQNIEELSQELSGLHKELARKSDQLAKIKAIVMEMERDTKLLLHIADLELSVGSVSVLKHAGIFDVGQLVNLTEGELLRIPNSGRKRLNEIKEVLANMGLALRSEANGGAVASELV